MKVQPRYAPQAVKKSFGNNPAAAPNVNAQAFTFPAPIRGIIENENLATPQPGGAQRLDNWFCTPTGVRMRYGSQKIATVANNAPVQSLFRYVNGTQEILFAATSNAVFDITIPANANVIPPASRSGMLSGDFSTTVFQTAGGYFLMTANGANPVAYYDGASWVEPTITGVASADLSAVWAYGSRLFFVEKESFFVWYLPTDSIAGTVNSVSLAGTFKKGGSILFGASWSTDSGSGLDDRCVIVSDQGEVAVFQGRDPSDANNWSVVGIYEIGRPLGKNAYFSAGGDLVIATELGLVPLSVAVNKDPAVLTLSAVTRQIALSWRAEVARRRSLPWNIAKWEAGGLLFVAMPTPGAMIPTYSYVASLETGAWSRVTGWDMRAVMVANDRVYFGTNIGTVHIADVGGSDDGSPYTASALYLADPMGTQGATKTLVQMRAVFRSTVTFSPKAGALVDYNTILPVVPSATTGSNVSLWDVSDWDEAVWDATGTSRVTAKWVSIGETGFVVAPYIQITSGDAAAPDIEFVSADVTFTTGEVVT